jgi:hypothetical protein
MHEWFLWMHRRARDRYASFRETHHSFPDVRGCVFYTHRNQFEFVRTRPVHVLQAVGYGRENALELLGGIEADVKVTAPSLDSTESPRCDSPRPLTVQMTRLPR